MPGSNETALMQAVTMHPVGVGVCVGDYILQWRAYTGGILKLPSECTCTCIAECTHQPPFCAWLELKYNILYTTMTWLLDPNLGLTCYGVLDVMCLYSLSLLWCRELRAASGPCHVCGRLSITWVHTLIKCYFCLPRRILALRSLLLRLTVLSLMAGWVWRGREWQEVLASEE